MATRVNCYLVEVDDCGQIQSADLVHSVEKIINRFTASDLDSFMLETYNADLYSVYFKQFPTKRSINKGAVSLRFYKNH